MAERIYQVGKYKGHRLHPAFKIVQRKDGGIRLTDIQDASNMERELVLAHFGRPLRSTTGVGTEQHRRLFEPGTREHFTHAVCELPTPFALMRRAK